jgi:tetratricopeptide (TPR) repeat protein
MYFRHRSSSWRPERAVGLFVVCAGLTCLAIVAAPFGAFAQPASKGVSKGSGKAAEKSAAATKTGSETEKPSEVKVLIGDSVDNPDSPEYKEVTDAIDSFRQGKFKEARELLNKARSAHRALPPAEVLMAKLLILSGQQQLALQQLEEAVKNNPRDPEAYLMYAEGLLADRRVTAAEALYRDADELVKAFSENPKRKAGFEKRVLHGLASVAESRQQWKTAESLLRQLIKLDPDNAAAHFRLGQVLFQQAGPNDNDRLSEAYKSFVAAVKGDPNLPTPDVAMGRLFEHAAQQAQNANDNAKFKHNRDQAAKSFERATLAKYNPDLNTLLSAAMWALQTNQFKLAQQYASDALKKDQDSLNAKLMAAVVARFSGNLKDAERLLQEAFNQSPANFAVSNQLALVLVESKDEADRKRALELAQTNYRLYQNNSEAVSTYGWVLYQLGAKSQAVQVLQSVVNSRALSPDSAYYVAQILADRDRNIEAAQILEDALEQTQPFASRSKAADLLASVRKQIESTPPDSKGAKTPPAGTGKGTK